MLRALLGGLLFAWVLYGQGPQTIAYSIIGALGIIYSELFYRGHLKILLLPQEFQNVVPGLADQNLSIDPMTVK